MTSVEKSLPLVTVAIFLGVAFCVSFVLSSNEVSNQHTSISTQINTVKAEMNSTSDETRSDDFDEQIIQIARDYKQYGLVDDEARWAPWLCRMPLPARVRFSKSDDSETHGEKLYFLYAKNRDAYVEIENDKQEVGQVVVKESWHPKETDKAIEAKGESDDDSGNDLAELLPPGGSVITITEKDGQAYTTGESAGLYIMFKLEPDTAGTDNGWVYATVTADGNTITASGKVDSCISCHQDAPHDRLFGLRD